MQPLDQTLSSKSFSKKRKMKEIQVCVYGRVGAGVKRTTGWWDCFFTTVSVSVSVSDSEFLFLCVCVSVGSFTSTYVCALHVPVHLYVCAYLVLEKQAGMCKAALNQ